MAAMPSPQTATAPPANPQHPPETAKPRTQTEGAPCDARGQGAMVGRPRLSQRSRRRARRREGRQAGVDAGCPAGVKPRLPEVQRGSLVGRAQGAGDGGGIKHGVPEQQAKESGPHAALGVGAGPAAARGGGVVRQGQSFHAQRPAAADRKR